MSGAIVETNSALLSFIERASRDQSFDIAKFGELLRLQRDIEQERARREFNIAMSEAQAEIQPVVRDKKNPHLGNKYARLETIDNALRPIYTARGFSVRYGSAPAPIDGQIRITCTVAHSGGYYEESYLDAPLSTAGSQGGRTGATGVQAIGSAITYLRRYLLTMCFNVVLSDDDDDAEGTRQAGADRRAADRLSKLAPTYEEPAEPPPRPAPQRSEAQWKSWLEKLRTSLAATHSRQDVEDVAGRDTVKEAVLGGPAWVQDDIGDLLNDAYTRHPVVQPEPETTPDDWPGPKP